MKAKTILLNSHGKSGLECSYFEETSFHSCA